MYQNKMPVTLPAIERLISRIAVAEKSQQRDVRITIQEARELTLELSLLTSRLATTVSEIHSALTKAVTNNSTVDVKMDGGNFS